MTRPFRQQVLGIAALVAIVLIGARVYSSRVTFMEQVQILRAESLAMSTTVVAYLERVFDSTDDTVAVAESYRHRFPKLTVLVQKSLRGEGRNLGVLAGR